MSAYTFLVSNCKVMVLTAGAFCRDSVFQEIEQLVSQHPDIMMVRLPHNSALVLL